MVSNFQAMDIQSHCIGCGACQAFFSDAIRMKLDSKGFYRPEIHEEKVSFPDFVQICPIIYDKEKRIYPVWGSYNRICSGFAWDRDLRRKASSGGVLSALLIYLLQENQVDAVIQCGEDRTNPLRNAVYINTTADMVRACSGSRYAPVCPLENIIDHTTDFQRYAFVGRPCDVRAMRKIMSRNPGIEKKILYCFSFFCAGTPSYHATMKILDVLGITEGDVQHIQYRGDGWPGCTNVQTADRTCHMMYQQSWNQILGRQTQPFCRICADGTGEEADIACGDAWELTPEMQPSFAEGEGINVILSRTDRGLALLEQTEKANIIGTAPYNPDMLRYAQKFQYERKATLSARIKAMRLMGKPAPEYNRADLKHLRKAMPIRRRLRYFLGTIKRCFEKKI